SIFSRAVPCASSERGTGFSYGVASTSTNVCDQACGTCIKAPAVSRNSEGRARPSQHINRGDGSGHVCQTDKDEPLPPTAGIQDRCPTPFRYAGSASPPRKQ